MKYLVGLLLGGLMEDPEPRFGNYNSLRNERRYYYCSECNSYHLTSK